VVVVTHQAVGMNDPVESFTDTAQHRQKVPSVLIIQVDVFLAVSP